MKIEIQRNEINTPIIYDNVESAYTKGPLFCVMFLKDGKRIVHKYPIDSIFRIVEDYYKEEPKKELLQEVSIPSVWTDLNEATGSITTTGTNINHSWNLNVTPTKKP